jgi:hypothetical protein
MTRTVAWFSCGIASTIAAKLALADDPDTLVVYCDTSADEHPDNERYIADCERWLDTPITRIQSDRYSSVDDVISSRRFMSGIVGAPCTVELKKRPRFAFQQPQDVQVFGYTVEETARADRLQQNDPGVTFWFPLIDRQITKADCHAALASAGITQPAMYRLGYNNNNCLGCVKATSATYWNRIRRDFPDVFAKRVAQSDELGVKLTRVNGVRTTLADLPADYLAPDDDEQITCGLDCQTSLFTQTDNV